MLQHRSAKGGLRRGGLNPPAVFRSFADNKQKDCQDPVPATKEEEATQNHFMGGFLRRNKRKKRQRKRLSKEEFFSSGVKRLESPSRILKPRTKERNGSVNSQEGEKAENNA